MRLILINSFGPMASSVIASICEKFGYLNLPIRKRNFHEYITKKRSLSDPYFKKETIRIFKSFERKKILVVLIYLLEIKVIIFKELIQKKIGKNLQF